VFAQGHHFSNAFVFFRELPRLVISRTGANKPSFHFDLHCWTRRSRGALSTSFAPFDWSRTSCLTDSLRGGFRPLSEAKSAGSGSSRQRWMPFVIFPAFSEQQNVSDLVKPSALGLESEDSKKCGENIYDLAQRNYIRGMGVGRGGRGGQSLPGFWKFQQKRLFF